MCHLNTIDKAKDKQINASVLFSTSAHFTCFSSSKQSSNQSTIYKKRCSTTGSNTKVQIIRFKVQEQIQAATTPRYKMCSSTGFQQSPHLLINSPVLVLSKNAVSCLVTGEDGMQIIFKIYLMKILEFLELLLFFDH